MINADWLNARLYGPPPGRVLHYVMFTEDGIRVSPDKFESWDVSHTQLVFANNLFPSDGQGGWLAEEWIDEDKTKVRLADKTKYPAGSVLCLDIESAGWKTAKKENNVFVPQPQAIEYRVRLLEFVHVERPDLLVGHYSQVPQRYYEALIGGQAGEDVFEALVPIAEAADILFPDFYVLSTLSSSQVLAWIEAGLQNARQYYPRKEVCPFLWPHLYDYWLQEPELRHTAMHERACRMDPQLWRAILELVYRYTDSWLWWDGEGGPPWDEQAPCWAVTKDVLTARGVSPIVMGD